jgi:uncharacterized phage-associated protein
MRFAWFWPSSRRRVVKCADVSAGGGRDRLGELAMQIFFTFNLTKALQAMAYIVARLGAVDKVKLMKLLYVAERDHFLRAGHPITGDSLYAMPWGPVPSCSLSAIGGESWPQPEIAFQYMHVTDNRVTIRESPGTSQLDPLEQQTLDAVIREHGAKDTWVFVRETHQYPEYKAVYVEGTSKRIPYDLLLKMYGGEQRYRFGRPVISEPMLAHMRCPLIPGSDADL